MLGKLQVEALLSERQNKNLTYQKELWIQGFIGALATPSSDVDTIT